MFDGETTTQNTLEFDVATAAIKGKRQYQEDSLLANFALGQGHGFAIVADGIGGHVDGHMASALVTTEVFNHLKMQEQHIEAGKLDIPFVLRQAAKSANDKIADHVKTHKDSKGMGTTMLVPVIRGDRLSWISVGDSPLLLLRNGVLRQINKDHSMAPQIDMMVKAGSMKLENGADHPDRHQLTSVMNGEDIKHVDCPSSAVQMKDGDVLIASTDGLQSVPTNKMVSAIIEGSIRGSLGIVKSLLDEVKKVDSPDQDNTTFVVIKTTAKMVEQDVMDLDAMPILAQADDAMPEPGSAAAAEARKEQVKKKVYWYRGQKYFQD